MEAAAADDDARSDGDGGSSIPIPENALG
jgi:SAM-dependent methyltransferase